MLRGILLCFVAIAGPWVVHLAPTRQRLMALVGFVGVLLLWIVLDESWFGKWWFWVSLIVGIASVFLVGGQSGSTGRRPPPRQRRPTDMTEEFGPPVRR